MNFNILTVKQQVINGIVINIPQAPIKRQTVLFMFRASGNPYMAKIDPFVIEVSAGPDMEKRAVAMATKLVSTHEHWNNKYCKVVLLNYVDTKHRPNNPQLIGHKLRGEYKWVHGAGNVSNSDWMEDYKLNRASGSHKHVAY